jgi:hypothetical protein
MAFAMMPRHIEVYDKMPEEEKKLWYTAKEVATAFPLYVWKKTHMDYLINSEDVRTRFYMSYTEDFINKMKDNYGYFGDFEYNCGAGSYYKVELRLHIEDVKKICTKGGYLYEHKDKVDRYDRVVPIEASYQVKEGLLEFINNRAHDVVQSTTRDRFFDNTFPKYKVRFMENSNVLQFDDDSIENNTHRLFFGYIMLHDYIKRVFLYLTGLTNSRLESILAAYGARFFRRRDFEGAHGKSRFKWLKENEFIKRVEFTFDSKYKYSGKFSKGYVYTVTEKTLKIVRDYMDYMLLKKKLPEMGKGLNDFGFGLTTFHDKKARFINGEDYSRFARGFDFFDYFTKKEHIIGLYKSVYGYVNSKEFFEWIDDDTIKRLHEERLPFRFNKFIWEYSRQNHFAGKERTSHIKKFMSGDSVWNVSTD